MDLFITNEFITNEMHHHCAKWAVVNFGIFSSFLNAMYYDKQLSIKDEVYTTLSCSQSSEKHLIKNNDRCCIMLYVYLINQVDTVFGTLLYQCLMTLHHLNDFASLSMFLAFDV